VQNEAEADRHNGCKVGTKEGHRLAVFVQEVAKQPERGIPIKFKFII
jgi:hypothetical protein